MVRRLLNAAPQLELRGRRFSATLLSMDYENTPIPSDYDENLDRPTASELRRALGRLNELGGHLTEQPCRGTLIPFERKVKTVPGAAETSITEEFRTCACGKPLLAAVPYEGEVGAKKEAVLCLSCDLAHLMPRFAEAV